MSDPHPDTSTDATPPKGNGSRFLALFLLGLVIGAFAVAYLMRMWLGGPDTYPRALMQVMNAQAAQLGENATQNRCNPTDTLPQLQTMRALANHLETAFVDLRDDRRFIGHASKLRASLDGALASPPLNCSGLAAVREDIKLACDACHQDLR
ncbi:MAG: hypothetical protein M3374_04690 [Pseudomonadota bacterium]|nr:hypothetical protein [Pseudomonadota bacterium]